VLPSVISNLFYQIKTADPIATENAPSDGAARLPHVVGRQYGCPANHTGARQRVPENSSLPGTTSRSQCREWTLQRTQTLQYCANSETHSGRTVKQRGESVRCKCLARQTGLEPTTLRFYGRGCQEKTLPLELKRSENSLASSPPVGELRQRRRRDLHAADLRFSVFPRMRRLVQNGPEPSRARRRRGLRTLDGEDRSETIREEGKQNRSQDDVRNAGEARRLQLSTIVLSETRWPKAFFGCPRGHRVNKETQCLRTPTKGLDTLPRNLSAPRIDRPTGAHSNPSTLKLLAASIALDRNVLLLSKLSKLRLQFYERASGAPLSASCLWRATACRSRPARQWYDWPGWLRS
jgi:hypothetical protein